MAAVSFKAKGRKVSFSTKGRKGGKRKLSAYNKHVRSVIRGRKKGESVQTAMKRAARSWKK